jgi:hypothetical protein
VVTVNVLAFIAVISVAAAPQAAVTVLRAAILFYGFGVGPG